MTSTLELTTKLGALSLSNPVLTAAGCGTGDPSLGGFVTRTLTLDPTSGPTGRRYVETPAGVLTDQGYDNPGVHAFLASELPDLVRAGVCTIVSVIGTSLGHYAELARRVGGAPGVAALEVRFTDLDPYAAAKCLAVVRRDVPRGVGVLAKIGYDAPDLARECVKAGADALVVGQAPRALALDPDTLAPSVHGRLSGPAIAPVALDAVWRLRRALPDVPLVGAGGIRTGADALAMLAVGADAVQIGAVAVHDPSAPTRILAELRALLGDRSLADVVGVAHLGGLQ